MRSLVEVHSHLHLHTCSLSGACVTGLAQAYLGRVRDAVSGCGDSLQSSHQPHPIVPVAGQKGQTGCGGHQRMRGQPWVLCTRGSAGNHCSTRNHSTGKHCSTDNHCSAGNHYTKHRQSLYLAQAIIVAQTIIVAQVIIVAQAIFSLLGVQHRQKLRRAREN